MEKEKPSQKEIKKFVNKGKADRDLLKYLAEVSARVIREQKKKNK